ncbi:SusC/RagA family TonB-linked outer membrane protein [Fulvivirga sp. RKSG066]|uniref:SusC/RagA family TonB-linked outer membrane protein n=1 Tax=Fulvivirga aurantia TaxID=2529383 RepID=UPI0012BB9EFD|nr:SusC/RagA family TonB-linked outer membrane protein [Fulvivirga aurantia]MTI20531.1 SusC/RagA family TonB-linked outer membrane protein [Fulvivirga aurantia]
MKKLLLFFGFVFVVGFTMAQERTVSGKVTSVEDGSTLPGVNVILKGTTSGTVTDVDGNYKLSVPAEGGTLVFSFIGLATEEIEIGSRSVIDLSMSPDVQQLSEVVVTAIGIEQNKRALGYSVQNVGGEELANAQETNLVNALNSKAAGVSVVSSSGTPGASANIRIRGNTSITGSNQPLFVVDGVPIDNNEAGNGTGGVDQSNRAIDLNPADIESLTILKGPSATALYGIRAANGAVVITTKKGKRNTAPVVTFSSSTEFSKVNKLIDLQQEYAQGTNGNYLDPSSFTGFSWGPKISSLEYDGDADYTWNPKGKLVAEGAGNGTPAEAFDNYNFFVTGVTTDNNINVRGGTEGTSYYMSVGYLNQTGVIPNSEFERVSFRSTVSTDITDKLTASLSGTYVNSGGVRMQRGSNLSGVMLGLIRNTPTFDLGLGKEGQDAADFQPAYQFANGGQRSYRDGIYDNPYWVVNKNFTEDVVNRVIGYISLDYEILPGLNAKYKLGIDNYIDSRVSAIEKVDNHDLTINWRPGEIQNREINSTDLNSDFILTYNKTINEDITISALAGHNYFESKSTDNIVTGSTIGALDFYNIANTSSVVASYNPVRRKVHGAYADVKFGYRDMLFLNFTGRNDWSSTLPSDENSFFYPSAALGFVLTEAMGVTDSYVKLRASWGKVGNDAPVYSTLNYYAQAAATGDGFIDGISFPFQGINAFEQDGTLGNNTLVAELTTTYEVGADIKLFNNRLGFDLTYYNSETEDQIIPVTVSAPSGFLTTVRNAGLVSNTGFEAVVTGTPLKGNDFSWDATLNFTTYETTVEELAPGIDNIFLAGFTSVSSRAIAGEPFGALYGDRYQRNEAGQLIIGSNGWPLQDPNAGIIGDPNPDWLLGFRNTFSYKGLALSVLLDVRQGGDVWNGTQGISNYFGTSQKSADNREMTGVVFDGVDQDGNPNNVQVDIANPAQGIGTYRYVRYGFGGLGEENIQDGSWVRLREVALSYSLPKSFLDSTPFKSASLSLIGRNLWVETPYEGIDPETNLTGASNGFGLDYFNNPNTRGYAVKLRVSL